MKKIISILLVLLALCACTGKNNQTKLSDGSEVIFKGPNVTYTKQDMYDTLKTVDSQAVVNDIMNKIALKNENIKLEDLNKEVDDLIEMYTSMGYESYILSQYGTMDAFREYYLSQLLYQELSKIYVNENYDKLNEENTPVKMQMATFNELADAEKCITDTNNGSTFDMAAVNNNSTSTPESNVYLDSDEAMALEVKDYINSTDTLGVSSVIIHADSTTGADGTVSETNTYYVLNIESRNPEDFKEDYIYLLSLKQTAETITNYFLSTHEVVFHDQDIYKMMSDAYEVLK